jgi:hypothetical protein
MALSQDGHTRTGFKKAGIFGVGGGEEGVRGQERNV